jgi:hypothetical protein
LKNRCLEGSSAEQKRPLARRSAPIESAARLCRGARKPCLAGFSLPGPPASLLILIFIMSWRVLHGGTRVKMKWQGNLPPGAWLGNEPAPAVPESWELGGAAFGVPRAPPRIRDPDRWLKANRADRRSALFFCFVNQESANDHCPLLTAGTTAGSEAG